VKFSALFSCFFTVFHTKQARNSALFALFRVKSLFRHELHEVNANLGKIRTLL